MKWKVTILEDDDAIREIIEITLQEHDIEVQGYDRATSFLEADHTNAHLILLDIMLPDGNGLEICCKLQENEQTMHIPIVIMSAHISGVNGSGCNPMDFIRKPFNLDDLEQRIKLHLVSDGRNGN